LDAFSSFHSTLFLFLLLIPKPIQLFPSQQSPHSNHRQGGEEELVEEKRRERRKESFEES